jgi:acetyltransferase-like isoleucine patch superfamily enzyme
MNLPAPFHALRQMSLIQQLSVSLKLMYGILCSIGFEEKKWVLAGPSLRIEKRFGEIRLGSLVGLGANVGIAVVGESPSRKAVLRIGAHTHIQDRAHINCYHSVTIGEHCAISWDVEILDTDIHIQLDEDGRPLERTAPVLIEDRVWIGTRAIILKGVTIGHDSIVAAGSVVTRSVPPHSICAGNPARVIRSTRGWIP